MGRILFLRPYLAALAVVLVVSCGVDEGYHLFVRDDDPVGFAVEMSNAVVPTRSVCDDPDAQDPLTMDLKIQALNPDDSVDVSYDRSVALVLESENGDTVELDPEVSPVFEDGEATLTEVTVSGQLVAGVPYVVRAEDEDNEEISGTSEDSITATVRSVDHFDVSYTAPSIIDPGVESAAFAVYVYPIDGDGNAFTQFDGVVDLAIDDGWTVSPAQIDFAGGYSYASGNVTVTGSGSFQGITATVADSADQPDDVTCLGGLAAGGGGGDGGGGGGSAEPDSLTCQVNLSPTSILTGQEFSINVTVTKTATNDTTYTSFTGTANVSSDVGTLTNSADGTSLTLTSISQWFAGFTVPNVEGSIEIGATVSDDESSLDNVTCTPATLTAETGIGVYGPHATYLVTELSEAMPSLDFLQVPSIGSLSDIEPYTILIINMDGLGWTSGRELSVDQAQHVYDYYDGGKPVFIAHDSMSQEVLGILGSICGVEGTERLGQDSEADEDNPGEWLPPSFQFNSVDSAGFIGSASVIPFYEVRTDAFTGTNISGTVVEARKDADATYYPIMVATSSPTRAILAGEAIYHPWGGEDAPDSQWWDEMPQLIQNAVEWLAP